MSPPIYKDTPDSHVTPSPDSHVTPPLTLSPLTMSPEEESLRRTNKEEPKKKIKSPPSKNQNNWIKALNHIGLTRYRLDPLKSQAPSFVDYWQPTEIVSEENGKIVIACVGKDPKYQKAWLDERGLNIAEHAMEAVTGEHIMVRFIVEEEQDD